MDAQSVAPSGDVDAFHGQELLLQLEEPFARPVPVAAVPAKRPVAGYDPMTRNYDPDR